MSDLLIAVGMFAAAFAAVSISVSLAYWSMRRSWAEDRAFWASVDSGRAEALRIWRDLPEGAFKDGVLRGVQKSIEAERHERRKDDRQS